jgi:hypothetical protein
MYSALRPRRRARRRWSAHEVGGTDLGQCQDFADVMVGVEPALSQVVVIGCCVGRECEKAQQQAFFAGAGAERSDFWHRWGLRCPDAGPTGVRGGR